MPTSAPSLYNREKDNTGKWKSPRKIKEGKGLKTSDIKGPFSIRPVIDGRQVWHPLASETFVEAKAEAISFYAKLEARANGVAVPELDDASRITLQAAVKDYIDHKENELGRRDSSIKQYRTALNMFAENAGVRYIDEVTESALRRYLRFLKEPLQGTDGELIRKGYSNKTIDTRMTVVYSLLKKNKIEARIDLPTVLKKKAIKFPDDVLNNLFAVMDEEEKIRYQFFLGTGCREQEVMYAVWGDFNLDTDLDKEPGTFTVRAKPDDGFEPKDHEERTIPLPKSLTLALRKRRENPPHEKWAFINGDNNPESHFLDKFKRIALKAGVNCGHCITTRSEGRYKKQVVTVSCKDHPTCEKMILHRLRKTCATRWSQQGIDARTIQEWLGHSSLEITQNYLGVTEPSKLIHKINQAYGD
jgi:integrase/recombinase XerD